MNRIFCQDVFVEDQVVEPAVTQWSLALLTIGVITSINALYYCFATSQLAPLNFLIPYTVSNTSEAPWTAAQASRLQKILSPNAKKG